MAYNLSDALGTQAWNRKKEYKDYLDSYSPGKTKSTNNRGGGKTGDGSQKPTNQNANPGGYGYISGGYSSYGGGGGSGSTDPTKEQKAAGKALGAVAGKQAGVLRDKFNNTKNALALANKNAEKTMNLNAHAIGRSSTAEWYHNALENPQKAFATLRNKSGTSMNGSSRLSMIDDIQRVYDDATVAAITNEIQQKNDNIYEYIQTVNKNNTDINKMAADIESALAQGAIDYVTQLINIHPNLINGKEKNFDKLVDTKAFDKGTKNVTAKQASDAIKIPAYLDYAGFYNKNKQNLVTPPYLTQIRPADARGTVLKKGLTAGASNVASAANINYLNALNTPYGQRNH